MRQSVVVVPVLIAVSAAYVTVRSSQLVPLADLVTASDRAFILMRPEPVPEANICYIEWSPSGRFLLMIQEFPSFSTAQFADALLKQRPPKTEFRLLTYDRVKHTVRGHWNVEALFGETEYQEMRSHASTFRPAWQWFADSDILYIEPKVDPETSELAGRQVRLMRSFDPSNGSLTLRRFDALSEGGSVDLLPSPRLPLLLVVHTLNRNPRVEGYVRTFDARGRTSELANLGNGLPRFRGWVGDGTVAKIEMRELEGRTVKSSRNLFFDTAKNQVIQVSTEPSEYRPTRLPSLVEIRMTPNSTSAGVVRVNHRAAWLSATTPSENPAVLLSAEAEQAELTAKLDAVAVLNRGVVTIRNIAILSRSTVESAMRTQAVLAAKEVGTGILMYAADYDDEFPLDEHISEKAVDPYLRNPDWMRDFRYFRPSGRSGNPATTMMGYIPAPGGYAAVYMDGHVEWKTGPPPKGG